MALKTKAIIQSDVENNVFTTSTSLQRADTEYGKKSLRL